MTVEQMRLWLLIIGIMLVSGFADSQGFIHAAQVWQSGTVAWDALGKSALGYGVGISLYWIDLRYMQKIGVTSPELQTVFWFGVTMVGVAATSGQFFQWSRLNQVVGVGVLMGIGWLSFRASG